MEEEEHLIIYLMRPENVKPMFFVITDTDILNKILAN